MKILCLIIKYNIKKLYTNYKTMKLLSYYYKPNKIISLKKLINFNFIYNPIYNK